MISGKRVAVILPAYNAARTLRQTYAEIPHDIVDDVILIDDASSDDTTAIARSLGIHTLSHSRNRGYGANQKSCYAAALARGADVIVMLHPDYQYTPRLVTAMASMIASDQYDVVLASRILGRGARQGGMPLYKYVREPLPDAIPKHRHGSEAVRVSQRLPRMEPRRAGGLAATRLLGRFRVRQRDASASIVVWFSDRRNLVSNQIFSRSLKHKFPSKLHLRSRRGANSG